MPLTPEKVLDYTDYIKTFTISINIMEREAMKLGENKKLAVQAAQEALKTFKSAFDRLQTAMDSGATRPVNSWGEDAILADIEAGGLLGDVQMLEYKARKVLNE
jgi:hypothetical protein